MSINNVGTKEECKHKWETDGDNCLACGAYEAMCKKCEVIGLFNSKGILLDIAE